MMEGIQNLPEMCLRLSLAVILAGALGLERQRKRRGAGLRTHILVCMGATLVVAVADLFATQWAASGTNVIMDKGRIAAGVITGVGFLGAGTIMSVGTERRGLTTAAMIWFVAALGVAIGAGYYFIAVLATAFALLVVLGLAGIDAYLPGEELFTLAIRLPQGLQRTDDVERFLVKQGCRVSTSRLQLKADGPHADMTFEVTAKSGILKEDFVGKLRGQFPAIEKIVLER